MAAFTYPGVYIEEISSGQHSITGVATSIAAFIGYTNVGPVDEAVMVESWSEYESLFGGMIPGVYLGYAVYQFFQNGGTQAYIVRLCDQSSGQAATAMATIGGLEIYANNPGSWGNNIAVAITGINSVNSTFNLQVYELTGSGSLSMVESYTNLSIYPANASYAVTIVNNDSNYIAFAPVVPPTPPPTLTLPTSSASYEGVYTVNGTFTGTINQGDTLKQSGSGAAEATVLVAPTATTPMTVQVKSGSIDTSNPTATWSETGVTFTQNGLPTQMPMALISGAIAGGPFKAGETVTQQQSASVSATAICVGSTPSTLPAALATPGLLLLQYITCAPANSFTQWKGGTSNAVLTPICAPVPTFAQPFATVSGYTQGADESAPLKPDDSTAPKFMEQLLNTQTPPAAPTGISLLANVPIFNLLCVPGECNLAAVSVLQSFCAANRAFLIVDAAQSAILGTGTNGLSATGPSDSSGATLVNPSAANSAFYFPWVQAPDPMAGFRPAYFPPCGFVAGIYATTDATRGVWKAPAGIDAGLTGALGLQYNLNDMQNGSLNVLGVNCLRQFPNFGNVVWGARTIAGSDALGSQWKYVPIRRLALFLESSLYQGTQWAVFEPNAEPLWGQVRLAIGSFLQGLFLKGAFAGTTPQQAYFVKCDGDNNPPASQALGILNISVGFAPVYPAEFVVIQIQQIMSQS
jgi:phage tail sheath protein FI